MSDAEKMIQCPYNTAHLILKSRMATHLVKCRQQYPVQRFETCPFNSTHDVPAPEIQYHMEVCPDRKQLESTLYIIDEPKEEDESFMNVELPSTSENWDEEVGTSCSGSYLNVKEDELARQRVFRHPVGMPKSERKKFVGTETQKFEEEVAHHSKTDLWK